MHVCSRSPQKPAFKFCWPGQPLMAASSSWLPAPAAPATTRGEPGLRVATYNMGAKTDSMFAGPARHIFERKLEGDIATLAEEDVICFQECSPAWATAVEHLLPGHAKVSSDEHGVATFVRRSIDVQECTSQHLFPGDDSIYRRWRRWNQVVLRTQPGDLYVVNNVHVIDGKDHRKIPGKTVRHKNIFKQKLVRNLFGAVVEKVRNLESAPATTRGTHRSIQHIIVGDFNMTEPLMEETCRTLDTAVFGSIHVCGENRDFMLASAPIAASTQVLPRAHDNQHTAMAVSLSPVVAPPPVQPEPAPAAEPLPVRESDYAATDPPSARQPPLDAASDSVEAQAWERSRTVLNAVYQRQAAAHEREEEEARRAEEEQQRTEEALAPEEGATPTEPAEEEEARRAEEEQQRSEEARGSFGRSVHVT